MFPFRIRPSIFFLCLFLLKNIPGVLAQEEEPEQPQVPGFWERHNAAHLTRQADALIKKYQYEEALELLRDAEKIWAAVPRSKASEAVLYTIWKQFGHVYGLQGRYDDAIDTYKKYLSWLPTPNSATYLATTTTLASLATCYNSKAEYPKAMELNRQALAITLKFGGPEHYQVASIYENMGNCYMNMGQRDSALVMYKLSRNLNLAHFGENSTSLAEDYHNLYAVYAAKSMFDSAYHYAQKSMALRLHFYLQEHPKLGFGYADLSDYFKEVGAYDSALVYAQKRLAHALRYLGPEDFGVVATYSNLGLIYVKKGDCERAIDYYNKAISIHKNYLDHQHPDLAKLYEQLSIAYNCLGDYGKANAYLEEAHRILLKRLGPKHPTTAYTYHNLGGQYFSQNDYDRAIENYTKALDIFLASAGETHADVAFTYNSLGTSYFRKGDYAHTLDCYQKALAIQQKVYGEAHPDLLNSCANLGYLLFKMGSKKEGYSYVEQALSMHEKYFADQELLNLNALNTIANMLQEDGRYDEAYGVCKQARTALNYLGPDSLAKVVNLPSLINTLDRFAKINLAWYTQTKDPTRQQEALHNYREALAALDHLSHQVSLASKSSLAEQAAAICANAIRLNHQLKQQTDSLHYWKTAFELAERSKAFLLYEAMQESRARHVAGIPDSLLEEEYNLRVDIASLEKSAWENPHLPANIKSENETKLFQLNERFNALRELFATKYPKYYSTRYDLQTIPLDSVQQRLLLPNQTLLEYTVGDSSLFLFLVQKDHFEVHELDRDSLEQWVDEMTRAGIYGFYTLPEGQRTAALEQATIERYTTRARQLYDKLLAPFREKLTPELIIIPAGVLGYLPFEALLTGAPGRIGVFSSYPFLLRERQISYCYSATLLREMRDKQHQQQPSNRLLAMAPFATGDAQTLYADSDNSVLSSEFTLRDSLAALKASGDEVAAIAKIWKAKSLLGNAATLEAFRELAPRYPILHLSTHGQADDRNGDYAYLAFSAPNEKGAFSKLYTRDLYNLELNADLVVLSACETGTGKLQRGEGIVSLARGVAYAGAKSLVTTLWKVNDAKAKDLMVGFYQYLKDGKPKDEALHLAKLDFLAKHQTGGGAALHPFFWAGFIAIGDMRPVR